MSKHKTSGTGRYPVIDYSKCNRCEKCIEICLLHAIEKIPNSNCDKCVKYCIQEKVTCFPFNYHFRDNLCNSCGDCLKICPEMAIKWIV